MYTTEQLNASLADRYVIERHIGEGGMATVYLARDLKHNRRVALKVLKPDIGAVVGVERFLSEIEVTANLQHPNLLPLFDSGAAENLLFYVMPYVEGESLRARLEREKQLPVDEAVGIATAVASALDYAHRHGVIHRDLKPENILLHEGQPLVADFGIALAVSNAGGNRITQTGLSLGTPQYMSPEQATGDRVIDGRSDIYSLGAVAYEMFTGEAPHTGMTSQAIIARVLTEKPRTIRSTRATVPAHVEAAIERALEKLAPDRFASAREFGDAISGARPVTLSVSAATATTPVIASPARRSRIALTRELALGAVAALAMASTAYLATRPDPPPPLPARFLIALPDSVTTAAATAHSLALSPDGAQLAVLGEKAGVRMIYIRRLEDPVAQPVRGTNGAAYHAFSADGRWLLFRASGALKTVPVEGGTPQTIAEAVSTGDASWGPLGDVLFAYQEGLWIVSSDGGDPRLVAGPDTALGIVRVSSPSFLPGGTHALVALVPLGGVAERRIGVLSLRDGAITDLGLVGYAARYVASGHIVFARDGGFAFASPFSLRSHSVTGPPVLLLEEVRQASAGAIALAVADNGTIAYETGSAGARQMYVVDRRGVERPLRSAPQMFWEPRVSPDGQHIAVRIGASQLEGDLWIYDLRASTLTRLTVDSASVRGEWTHDGARIVYVNRSQPDSQRLVSRPWDGSGAATVLASGARPDYVQVSIGPQAGLSAIRRGGLADGNADIQLAQSDNLDAPRDFLATPAQEYDPRVSPDGTLLAYTSSKSRRREVYVTPIPGPGPHVQVSVDGGAEPVWSSDGDALFYRGPVRMMAATVVARPAIGIARRDSLFVDIYHSYYPHGAYDVFPGGQEFVMTRGPDARTSIFVVLNWQQLSRAPTREAGDR